MRDQYEDYWSTVRDHARRIVAVEPSNLARAVSLCLAAYAERPRKTRWLRGRRVAAILAGQTLPPLLSPRCVDTITRVAITDLVASYCSADTKRIIELGSGWGTNLFYLWLGGMSRSASYVAMEYTETGRDVTQLLASTEPQLALSTRTFDYYRPDLSEYRTSDKTVVFTSYSIEQITHLSELVVRGVAGNPRPRPSDHDSSLDPLARGSGRYDEPPVRRYRAVRRGLEETAFSSSFRLWMLAVDVPQLVALESCPSASFPVSIASDRLARKRPSSFNINQRRSR